MSRMNDLLTAAAKRYDDGGNPFGPEWLAEYSVTLDECLELAQQVALAIRVYQVTVSMGLEGSVSDRKVAGLIMGGVAYKESKIELDRQRRAVLKAVPTIGTIEEEFVKAYQHWQKLQREWAGSSHSAELSAEMDEAQRNLHQRRRQLGEIYDVSKED